MGEGVTDPNALNGATNNDEAVSGTSLKWKPGASYQTVLFKPLSGFPNQLKYLPLRFMPIALELSLVNDPLDPIISDFTHYVVGLLRAMNLHMCIHQLHGKSRMYK